MINKDRIKSDNNFHKLILRFSSEVFPFYFSRCHISVLSCKNRSQKAAKMTLLTFKSICHQNQ